jgi:hypothetical protein
MLRQILFATPLMLVCLAVQIGVLQALVWHLLKGRDRVAAPSRPLHVVLILAQVFLGLMASHILHVMVWASFYFFSGALTTVHNALYFSIVSYTTIGYGDVILPPEWQLLGGVEAMTGVLLLGWSTAFSFLVLNKIYEAATRSRAER